MANVRISTVSNKPLAAYNSAEEYVQDIPPGSLLQSIHDGVRNPHELYYYLPAALINAMPVRRLEFIFGVEPNNPASFASKNLWENIGSYLVYITGVEVPHPGGRMPCIKKFPLIVIPKLIYDYHSDDPGNSRKKFEKSKRLRMPELERRALSLKELSLSPIFLNSLPQPDAPLSAAPEATALQPIAPQSVATQPAASQFLAAQPVASHPAPAQPGGQPSGRGAIRGALRGTRRGPPRGGASRGVSSRRGTNVPVRSDHQGQTMLSKASHGFTQTQPGALSSVGSVGGGSQTRSTGTASYQMSPYQTAYHTTPAQPTLNAMQSSFQDIGPPGSHARAPLIRPQNSGTSWSQNENLHFSHINNCSQGFGNINPQRPSQMTAWNSQQERAEENNTSFLPHQSPANQTLDLLQLGSQPAAFQQTHTVYGQTQQTFRQQSGPRWVNPRLLTRQQSPAQVELVSDAAFSNSI